MNKKGNKYKTNSTEELSDIYHKKDDSNFERMKKREDVRTTIYRSPEREENTKKLINPDLEIEKIPEMKNIKTPDYKIESEKIYIEVKGMDLPIQHSYRYELDEQYLVNKINSKIEEISEKNKLKKPDYHIGGIIFLDHILGSWLMKDTSVIEQLVSASEFKNSKIDFLLFITDPNGELLRNELNSKIIFIKNNKIKHKIEKIFLNIQIVEI